MFCCDFCLEIGAAVLRRVGNFVVGDCLHHGGYEALHQNEKQTVGAGLKKGSTAVVDYLDDPDELQYNIVVNPKFWKGTDGWYGVGCSLAVESHDGFSYCIAHERNEKRQGLAQEIGKRLDSNVEYRVEAWVGMRGGQAQQALVQSTLKVEKTMGGGEEVILLNCVTVSRGEWSLLPGSVHLSDQPYKATLYFDGPIGGIDILVSSVAVVPTSTTVPGVENERAVDSFHIADPTLSKQPVPRYGVNIITNSNLWDGLDFWYPMGNCSLSLRSGGPTDVGVCAKMSLFNTTLPILSGNYIYCSNRTEIFEGPAQDITGKMQLYQTYQVSAWVATTLPPESPGTATNQRMSMSLEVDGQWMQGGEVAANEEWIEVSGSFRVEVEPKKVIFYVQGADPGVDVMLSGLQIFAVDRLARVPFLQQQAEKFRKRDVVIRPRNLDGCGLLPGTKVSVTQTKIAFPIGTCITSTKLEDEFYKKFLLDHFSWAVFENALKWDQIQPEVDDVSYEKSDYLIRFCQANEIPMRGHCIVWENESLLPDWVTGLYGNELLDAIFDRVTGLLTRYKGEFEHYDVINEILHGSFIEERLGDEIMPEMFKLCHKLDPKAILFVNEYHVEDGYDYRSAPEKYVGMVKYLQANGAPVGGIGVQGHIRAPVGPVISNALNMLSTLDLSIWFTEVDLPSISEEVRADDLEVMLREAFAYPLVNGFILWGFMEGAMSKENAHLVDADNRVNAAGKRLLDLKKEWKTEFQGVIDGNGELLFRGYHGNYTLAVQGGDEFKFEVVRGDGYALIELPN